MFCDVKRVNIIAIQKRGLVEKDSNEIVDIVAFNKYNDENTELAKTKYGVTNPGKLYNTTRTEVKLQHGSSNSRDNIKTVHRYFQNQEFFNELQEKHNQRNQESNVSSQVNNVRNIIKDSLPTEISNAITVVEDVPVDILGRDDLFLSIKDILNDNGINDELLINWFGIKKAGHPNSIKSEQDINNIIEKRYNKLKNVENHPELKANKLALESFNKWVAALKNYPAPFREIMLSHAIKYLNPQRRAKYVLQLSEVALTQSYGIVANKPHELNRIGKLYDSEVLKTVGDAVGHEPSESGKGYWIHIPRTEKSLTEEDEISLTATLEKFKNPENVTKTFGYDNTRYYVENNIIHRLSAGLSLSASEVNTLIKEIENKLKNTSPQFKVNVELLRKLSPSTWCTASGMASHYVENYDNYLLIVNGVTVAGIEAMPASNLDEKKFNYTIEKINDRYRVFVNGKLDEFILSFNTKEEAEKAINSYTKVNKRKVKEVTSRGNNGVSSIDHYDDIFAFFEKHSLDTNNASLQKAKKAKDAGKVDVEINEYDWRDDMQEDRGDVDDIAGEYRREEEEREILQNIENERFHVTTFETIEEAIADEELSIKYFSQLKPSIRNNEQLATKAVERDSHNITLIDETLPLYFTLAKKAVEKNAYIFVYLSPEAQNIPGLKRLYDIYQEINDTLPFSKTDTNQIQGYYDAKNDKVVVVANNTPVNEAAKVAIHEVAHRGMIRMAKDLGGVKELGKVLFASEKQLMQKLPELLQRTGHKSLENLMLDYGFTTTSEEGKIKLLSELAARWAETLVDKPKPSWWKEFLTSIQNWIKKFTGKTLNEEEVNELVGGFVKYGTQNKQDDGDFYQTASESKEQVNERINTKLKNFLLKQGISLEYLDKITDEFGGNINSVFNSVKKTIKVAKGEERLDTLPEEVGHAITRGLGKNHLLVKKLFNLIKRTDYKSKLDPRYVELYKGNEDALIEELAGKYIAQAIINEYKEDANILDTIKKLIKKFLELFKTSNLSDLQQIEKDIQSVSNELAKTVETNELLKFNTRDLPSNPELFQVSEDSSKGEKFTVYSNFPMHTSNLEKIGTEKRFSVRPKFHPTGYYKIQDAYYKITNVYDKQVNVSDIKNPKHIRDKSIREDEIKYEHIKDFYDGRESMYVYQIQRLEGEIVNQLKEDEKTQKKGFSGQKHEAELVTISRLINVLKKRLVRLKEEGESEAKLQKAKDDLSVLQTQLSVYKQDRDIEILESLANEALNRAEQFIRAVQQLEKTGKLSDKVTDVDFGFAREILERFTDKLSAGDKNRAAALWGELLELQDNHILEYVKKHDTSGKEINTEALNTEEQKQDIGSYKRWTGKLSTVTNKIGATIGSMINKAHDRVSAKNKETKHKIEAQIKALTEYQNSKGIQGKDIFNIFIQEANGTTVLTRPYTTAFYDLLASKEDSKDKLTVATYDKVNKRYVPHDLVKYTNQNYLTIQKEKPLRDFYNFHKELTKQLKEVLPTTVKEDFIANLRVDLYDQIKRGDKTVLKGLAGTFKNLIQVKEVRLGDFQAMEELKADMLDARKYQAKLSPEEKSRDLGQNLLAFAQFVNSYEELSDTLPKVRVLQSHLNETKNFIKSTGPGDRIDGKDTNLAALVEDTIKMQLLGQMKEEGVKIELEDSIDENGDPIKRYVSVSQIGDLMLKFNSLLRIGLNPMNAISNLSFGEVSNFIEASGGRFYNIKNMNDATAIFLKQTNNPDSVINRILEIVNPLQEIEDYENIESIKTKGQLSSDKIQDIMYTPQKMGEKFIQSRPMIAMMLKQGLLTKEGVLTKEGEEFLKDKEKVARFSTKVKGLNEKRHGRYSQRSAAALQQQLWFRVASQFKKWMSAAYEDRFESKYTDNDIGEDFEGRYITFKNTVLKEIRKGNIKNAFTNMFVPLFNSKKLLKENGGNLTELEVYNMRRNLTEAIILMSTVLIFNLLKGGDDDKERRKKPAVKFALEQLNRLAGDLELFYNPKAFNKTFLGAAIPLEKTINDIIKIGVDIPMLLFSDSDKLYYTSGEKKNELKILADITSATPILSPIVKTIRLFKKDVGYVSPNK